MKVKSQSIDKEQTYIYCFCRQLVFILSNYRIYQRQNEVAKPINYNLLAKLFSNSFGNMNSHGHFKNLSILLNFNYMYAKKTTITTNNNLLNFDLELFEYRSISNGSWHDQETT